MKFPINSPQKGVRVIPAVLNGTSGTPAFAEGSTQLTVVDTGVGIYTCTLDQPGARACVVLASAKQSDLIVTVLSESLSGFQIRCFDATDGTTAKDGNVSLLVCAIDSADAI